MPTLNDKFNLAMSFKKGQQRDKKSEIRVEQKLRKVTGTATSDSKDGKVMVRLVEGDAVEMSTIASIKNGDTVSVIISNGIPTVQGVIGWGDLIQSQADATKAEVETVKTTYATKSELSATDTELRGEVSDSLTTAKSYTDSSIATEVTNRDAAIKAKADFISLEVSKTYTKAETFSAYQSDADQRIATAKKAGTDAQANLDSYKTANDQVVARNTASISQMSDSITSAVSGSTTYTAPDGTQKTNALATKVSQTATDVITAIQDASTAVSTAKAAASDAASAKTNAGKASEDAAAAIAETKDLVTLRIDSSRGTVFKNSLVSTVLTVRCYKRGQELTTLAELRQAMLDATARIRWYVLREGDTDWVSLADSDHMLSNDGFTLTVTPDDVSVKCTFKAEIVTD